jgi:uncharacterized protein (TIGR00299 family) protein
MTHLLWLDCSAGASGDMLLGALLDAGAPLESVAAAIDALVPDSVTLTVSRTARHGIGAARAEVTVAADPQPRRTWRDVRELLAAATLPEAVRSLATDAFARLARAEGAVHGVDPEDVHFHEVGALDSIADVVGVAAALHALAVDRVLASPVALGSGRVRGEHGVIPVPGPAVLALLADAGAPVEGGPAAHEMTTPTGAALLAATVTGWGPLPRLTVTAVGVGAGGRDPAEVPNLLRAVLGEAYEIEATPAYGGPLVLATNVDDQDQRLWPRVIERLLAAGASDAWLIPILMKKGRPAHTLSVLVNAERADAVRRVIFAETTAIGLREHPVRKVALDRTEASVEVGGQPVRVKLACLDGVVVNAQPEHADVVAAAAALDLPAKVVLARAVAAAGSAGLLP